jgi:hypothetical protein
MSGVPSNSGLRRTRALSMSAVPESGCLNSGRRRTLTAGLAEALADRALRAEVPPDSGPYDCLSTTRTTCLR